MLQTHFPVGLHRFGDRDRDNLLNLKLVMLRFLYKASMGESWDSSNLSQLNIYSYG